MCYGCPKMVCDCRCPDAPEPQTIGTCQECGDGIQIGEEYAEINGVKYHLECLEDMPTKKLLEMLDVGVETAKEESEW